MKDIDKSDELVGGQTSKHANWKTQWPIVKSILLYQRDL